MSGLRVLKIRSSALTKGGLLVASEFISEILRTEEDCKQKEAESKRLAEEKRLRAKADAAALIAEAETQVRKMVSDDAEAVSKSSEMRLQKERDKVQKECDALSATAERNTKRVAKLVAQEIAE